MSRKSLFPLFAAAVVALAIAAEFSPTSPAGAGDASSGAGRAVAHAAAKNSLTAKAVKAAKAFKATLSDSQVAAMQFSFSDAKKKSGWSNLPTSLVARNGLKTADLSTAEIEKLNQLLKVILSGQGYKDEEAVRKADAYLAANGGNSMGGPGGATLSYGEGLYYVAFFGTPSKSKKWTVQFGGHHLAIHMTFAGKTVNNTPYFFGAEPKSAFTQDGKTYQPTADEANALFGAVQSLNTTQLAQAKLSGTFDDVVVGPQKDGTFPTQEGIKVTDLSASQQTIVLRAIKSYLYDEPTAEAKKRFKVYKRQLSKTTLGWAGATDGDTAGSYARIDGPRVWIEIATQNGIVFQNATHYHSIERDKQSDYGE